MSKMNDLLKTVEIFEKCALNGNKKTFLQKLAQNNINTAISSLDQTIQNWSSQFPNVQMPSVMQNAAQIIRNYSGNEKIDDNALVTIQNAAKQLGTSQNLGNMSSDARMAWLENVFPVAGKVQFIESTPDNSNEEEVISVPETTIQVEKPRKTLAQTAEEMTKYLVNIANHLPTGPVRKQKLIELNNGIRYVKSLFTIFQGRKTKDLKEYFAMMNIAEALKQIYSLLSYDEVNDIVTSLKGASGSPGGGIPEIG